jgi:hypothetical protein
MIHSDLLPENGSNSLWINPVRRAGGDPQRLPAGKRRKLAVDQPRGRRRTVIHSDLLPDSGGNPPWINHPDPDPRHPPTALVAAATPMINADLPSLSGF